MREIESNDAGNLRTILRLKEGDAIPAKVEEMYWVFKRLWDRVMSRPLPTESLITIAILAEEAKSLPEDADVKYIPELYQKGEFHYGQRVEVVWRKKEVSGTFQRLGKNNKVVVVIDGEGEEREFAAETVRPVGVLVRS
jgi:hypothetical protein